MILRLAKGARSGSLGQSVKGELASVATKTANIGGR
jgi:hypothetical protein